MDEEAANELDEIEQRLWQSEQGQEVQLNSQHIFEQYKLCVEMVDRISSRRGIANTFFLSLNTAIIGALSAFYKDVPSDVGDTFLFVAIILCITWAFLLRSYRTLSRAKFKVIGLMEKRLPASPFWAAEWKALAEGKDWRIHMSLVPIETVVPFAFVLAYAYLLWS